MQNHLKIRGRKKLVIKSKLEIQSTDNSTSKRNK